MPQQIRTVAIVGCGMIGMSWATLCLSRGLKVIVSDPATGAKEALQRYLDQARPFLEAQGNSEELATNYEFVSDIVPRLAEADFVQENGPERQEFKRELMKTLDEWTRPGVVIASSSSGLPSSAFIQQCKRDPSRILIGHPFNPPHLIPLVEVVPHAGTSEEYISTAMRFYQSLGKKPILVHQEVPGFVSNRLQAAINNEAYSLISRGVVSAEDLDFAVTQGPGLRWALTGPIVTNALGGGGGPDGFGRRIERLGPSIRAWEDDMLKHRFDWSDERLSSLQDSVQEWLGATDWTNLVEDRDSILVKLLAAKSKATSMRTDLP
ncbi:hypothetical protein BDV33DRAFT_187171 [Aspergillus novoparasiticus]|uniref:3-hydroxyacyl-CoA dehydrogenase n=1 Tax=Aspergillus novoparasiticus TaxID=986946 RepID=A0A5N6F9R2_9EURO|nr:hypothetical protein BDV33DRAFT_187171 [Aspergillus novoparasiticus]